MKKIVLLIVILNFTPLFAQQVAVTGTFTGQLGELEPFQRVNNFYLLDETLRGMTVDIEDTDSYLGTPYGNPSFLLGDIYNNNQIHIKDIYLRYNVIADEIEIKESLTTHIEEAKSLPKTKNVFVTINNDKFIFIPYPKNTDKRGYFQVLFEGNNCNLLKKHLKKFYPAVIESNSDKDTPATFKDKSVYYIVTKDDKFFELPKSKKNILKLFENNQSIIKKYIKTNNLKLKNEMDLKKLIIYVDSLDNLKLTE